MTRTGKGVCVFVYRLNSKRQEHWSRHPKYKFHRIATSKAWGQVTIVYERDKNTERWLKFAVRPKYTFLPCNSLGSDNFTAKFHVKYRYVRQLVRIVRCAKSHTCIICRLQQISLPAGLVPIVFLFFCHPFTTKGKLYKIIMHFFPRETPIAPFGCRTIL